LRLLQNVLELPSFNQHTTDLNFVRGEINLAIYSTALIFVTFYHEKVRERNGRSYMFVYLRDHIESLILFAYTE